MDFEQARHNMIEQQIRPWEVLDPAVLGVLETVRREEFVPSAHRELAFADLSIPLPGDAAMMQPKLEARLIQSLEIKAGDRVLQVGVGSGHVAALLASLGGDVTAVELRPELVSYANERLIQQGFDNVSVVQGEASGGWSDGAPWDAILLTGSVASIDENLRDSLAPGGRLVAVVGSAPIMEAYAVKRLGESSFRTESLFDTLLPALDNATTAPAFEF